MFHESRPSFAPWCSSSNSLYLHGTTAHMYTNVSVLAFGGADNKLCTQHKVQMVQANHTVHGHA